MPDIIPAILSATRSPVAIFTDFDGTLVDIAPTPDAVEVPPDLAERLSDLHEALGGALAVITGRTISDIDGFLPDQAFSVTGSHGAERRHAGSQSAPDAGLLADARRLNERIKSTMGLEAGILIEPKPTGVAVHYRAAPEKGPLARSTLDAALEGFDDFHAVDGKKVIEARPRSADKGSAITQLMQVKPFAGRVPVFLGDDVTDEDGFKAAQALGGFGIKIGSGETAARFRLPDIAAAYGYFDALIARERNARASALAKNPLEESMVK